MPPKKKEKVDTKEEKPRKRVPKRKPEVTVGDSPPAKTSKTGPTKAKVDELATLFLNGGSGVERYLEEHDMSAVNHSDVLYSAFISHPSPAIGIAIVGQLLSGGLDPTQTMSKGNTSFHDFVRRQAPDVYANFNRYYTPKTIQT